MHALLDRLEQNLDRETFARVLEAVEDAIAPRDSLAYLW